MTPYFCNPILFLMTERTRGTSYNVPVKRENEEISSFVKTASYKNLLILGTLFPSNPITDLSSTRRFSRPWRTLNLSVISIRHATRWWLSSIPYPDFKVQREALDCPSRGPFMASTLLLGLLSSKTKILLPYVEISWIKLLPFLHQGPGNHQQFG